MEEFQAEVYVVPALRGVPRRLIEALPPDQFVAGVAWNPGGTEVTYYVGHLDGSPGEIHARSCIALDARSPCPMLEPLGPVEFSQLAVERPQWQVSRLARDLEDEAVGEADGGLLPVVCECSTNRIRVL